MTSYAVRAVMSKVHDERSKMQTALDTSKLLDTHEKQQAEEEIGHHHN